jgi:hypothetical protein
MHHKRLRYEAQRNLAKERIVEVGGANGSREGRNGVPPVP